MRATVVLLGTVEEQRANGDRYVVDPQGIRLDALDFPSPLWRGFSTRERSGLVHRVWLEDGRLMAEIDVTGMDVSIGGTTESSWRNGPEVVDRGFRLLQVSLVDKPAVPR